MRNSPRSARAYHNVSKGPTKWRARTQRRFLSPVLERTSFLRRTPRGYLAFNNITRRMGGWAGGHGQRAVARGVMLLVLYTQGQCNLGTHGMHRNGFRAGSGMGTTGEYIGISFSFLGPVHHGGCFHGFLKVYFVRTLGFEDAW
jgi:hypothetical protein